MRRALIFFAGLLATAFLGVARGEEVAVSSAAAPTEPAHVYKGDRMRDPFIPLTGQGAVSMESAMAKVDLGPFNPTGAELKGILKTPTGRWALIRTTDGLTYMVQNGRVYDPKRKLISGFQGIVKEKTVVILAPGNQEFELRTKKDEEAAKKQ